MAITPNLGLPLIDGAMTADVPRDMNALANAVDTAVETAIDEAVAGVSIPDASLTVKGKTQLSSATNSTLEDRAATPKAVNDARIAAETSAKDASLPRSGGSLSGRVDFQTWGSFSADAGGGVLYGSNCYLDPSGSPRTFRYTNTHINFGARGIFLNYKNGSTSVEIYEFDTGAITSTAGASFTPVLKRILNIDDYDALFQLVSNGKSAIAAAITGKGVAASGSDTHQQLATKVQAIETGKKSAVGTFVINTSGQGSVTGLGFQPRNIIINDATYPTSTQSTYFLVYSADAYTLRNGSQEPLNQTRGKNNGTQTENQITVTATGFTVNAPAVNNGRTYRYVATN